MKNTIDTNPAHTTIKEVARLAGVSTATVSRVFNNPEAVEPRTTRKVRDAALKLHYVPHPLGRGLSTQRTDSIGLLLPDLYGEFFSEIIRGCDQTAQKNHFHLIVSSSHANRQEIEAALGMMRGRVDGLVIMSGHIDTELLRANIASSLPVVLLGCRDEAESFDSITIDNQGGAFQMVRHLLGHGYMRIAIIKGPQTNFDARQRLQGFRRAIEEFGGDRGDGLEQPGSFTEASGYDAAERLLALSPRPRAIFAANDAMAIGALSALRDAGIHVPGEIALAGFDDIPVAAYLTPSLSTVHVGVDCLGVMAVQALLPAIRQRANTHRQQSVIDTTLSIRESCGCTK